jgi:hypothetical protein
VTLNGRPITGDGEKCDLDCAQNASPSLPLRPERARANDAAAWKPTPVVAANSADGDTDMKGPTIVGPVQRDYMN